MSGICGIIRFDGKAVDKGEVQAMLDAMQNRGNDAQKIWLDGSAGFGHKMLWTTPESLYEVQPIVSREGDLVLTADARIDNRSELFGELGISDNGTKIVTDADLILCAYQKWGEASPEHLRGDFSFAVWDRMREEIFIVRDRIGVKPLIYYFTEEYFLFSSEVSPIFTYEGVERSIDLESLKDYLHSNVNHAIDFHKTFFEDIHRLPAASSMRVRKKSRKITRYWDRTTFQVANSKSLEENSAILLQRLREAVTCRLRSAYPVGVELSGGLDSSTVSALAAEKNASVKTFSLRFPTMNCDEGEYIDAVTEKTGCMNFSVDVGTLDFSKENSVDAYYQRFPDWPVQGFFLPFVPLMELEKSHHVRILLTGQGGDHITQGNLYYLTDWVREGAVIKALKQALQEEEPWGVIKKFILKPFFPRWVLLIREALEKRRPYAYTGLSDPGYQRDYDDVADDEKYRSESARQEAQILFGSNQALAFDLWHYQLAGRFGIEVWHPFYDSRLIEFALQIPKDQKHAMGISKLVLQEATKGILPDCVRTRNSKVNFNEAIWQQIDENVPQHFFDSLEIFDIGLLNQQEYNYIREARYNENKECICTSNIWKTFCAEIWYSRNMNKKR